MDPPPPTANPLTNKSSPQTREHTGRWTKEEHEAFLSALQQYGKEWKKVAARVKTRTVVQTRTHAQKYFQKLNKVLDGKQQSGGSLGVTAGYSGGGLSLGSSSAQIRTAQNLAASLPHGGEGKKKKAKTVAATAGAAAHGGPVNASQFPPMAMQDAAQQTPRTTSTAEALLNMSAFSGPVEYEAGANINAAVSTAKSGNEESSHGFYNLSIALPPDAEGKHPEPSPAACGKRKVDEIAAAEMLAGVVHDGTNVAAGGTGTHAVTNTNEYPDEAITTNNDETELLGFTPMPLKRDYNTMEFQTEDDAFLAEVFGVDAVRSPENQPDGTTVGPETSMSPTHQSQPPQEGLFSSKMGSNLQIVNPDDLVIPSRGAAGNSSSQRGRMVNGQASPCTPWDGQLEALVSHVHPQDASSPTQTTPNPLTAPQNQTLSLPPPLRHPTTSLEHALCSSSPDLTELFSSQPLPKELNPRGYHILHMAACIGNSGICTALTEGGVDVCLRDRDGNTALHWGGRSGSVEVLKVLLRRNCPIDCQNDSNETALHWAMRAGSRGMAAVQLLVESGARTNLYSRAFKRPLDVAAEGYVSLEKDETIVNNVNANSIADTTIDPIERKTTRWNMLHFSSQCRTLVLHHHECLDHMTKSRNDWEAPDRIDSIMSTLASRTSTSPRPERPEQFNSCEITVSNEFERATLELLSRIHSADYLAFVNELSKELDRKKKLTWLENVNRESSEKDDVQSSTEREEHILPFTPMIQKKFIKEAMSMEERKADGHSDTSFSAGSLKAARRAAGAVQHAVDCVLVGRNRNAFCVIRPPGHHAGINGLLSNAESCGFCLFNNVAAGAMHALSDEKHRPRCERCAIVDIDAHHGNGTEEIVRKCHDSGRLLFFSVHLYDYDKPKKGSDFNYKFYPGTGADDDVPHNVINVPIAPLWREKEVVRGISSSISNGTSTTERAQTRLKTKADSRASSSTNLKEMVSDPLHQLVGDGSESNESSSSTKPKSQLPSSSPHYPSHYLMGVGRLAYRRAIQHRLLPALRAFNPDLIIMSTGFDAARGDVGNARHFMNGTQAMGLDLEPEDYAWTSRKICEVADICCNGKVVSVLEGGYGRSPPPIPPPPLADAASGEEVRQPLEKSFFSECAMHHLQGLVDPYAK